jgi:putative endonuclease
MSWYVYIIECSDKLLYTGVTLDLRRRLVEHNSGGRSGSKFIRARRPVKLVYSETLPDKSLALKRELEIKGWSRKKKLKLIEEH